MMTLSIRQPWAWLIATGFKDVENRKWRTGFRGQFLIHAGKGMTRAEYDDAFEAADWVFRKGKGSETPAFPSFEALQRGGIIGQGRIVACVEESESDWFCGPYAFVIEDAKRLPFHPCRGQLGFFDVDYPEALR